MHELVERALSHVVSQQESKCLEYALEALGCCYHCHDAADVAQGVKDVEHVHCDGWYDRSQFAAYVSVKDVS